MKIVQSDISKLNYIEFIIGIKGKKMTN